MSMPRLRGFIARSALALLVALPCAAADLTPEERRWLQGAAPVLSFARGMGLPLDVIVQRQAAVVAAPLSLAFIGGRCKLVLSLRGNREAAALLGRIEPELFDVTIELMAAHELGHCQRYAEGHWRGLPAGFNSRAPAVQDPVLRAEQEQMRTIRREEGYADLVGLAWVQQRHPALFPRLHAWLVAERSNGRVPGGHHDTLAWARLARDGVSADDGASIFDAAAALWTAGLAADD
jgi:hypothetical protein